MLASQPEVWEALRKVALRVLGEVLAFGALGALDALGALGALSAF